MKIGTRQLVLFSVIAIVIVEARKKPLKLNSFSEQAHSQGHSMLKSAPIVDDKQFQLPSDEPDQKFYWRVDMTPPVLRVGWQTDQSANFKDLTFNFNPAKFQSNPRIGPDLTPATPATPTTPAIPAPPPFSFNQPLGTVFGGVTPATAPTATPFVACSPYYSCYAGNNGGPSPTAGTAQPVTSLASSKLPCFPTTTGECDVTALPPLGNSATQTPAVSPANYGGYESAATNTAKKYQYWSVKVKPYLETQVSIQNKIYVDQLMQVDLNFDVTSFKSFLYGEGSIWYQYDSSNPTIANSGGIETNYRNYFLCGGFGITIKPILMSITVAIKLRNCYKTLIQSLTDWSNWDKLGADALYYGLLDYCRNSDSETVTVFSFNPIPTDRNYIFAGNMENNDPSFDWNGGESSGIYIDGNMQRKYNFDYCYPLKSGDKFFDFNEYELYNGGPNGDLYCSKNPFWQPKKPFTPTAFYDYTAKSCA